MPFPRVSKLLALQSLDPESGVETICIGHVTTRKVWSVRWGAGAEHMAAVSAPSWSHDPFFLAPKPPLPRSTVPQPTKQP